MLKKLKQFEHWLAHVNEPQPVPNIKHIATMQGSEKRLTTGKLGAHVIGSPGRRLEGHYRSSEKVSRF